MIENEIDPGRGRGGRHHGGRRSSQQIAGESEGFRQIAVHVDESEAGAARLGLACHLAKAFRAELIGIGCIPAEGGAAPVHAEIQPPIAEAPMPNLPGVLMPALSTNGVREVGDSQREEHATEQWFRGRAARADVPLLGWRVIGYGALNEMLAYAKTSDLTILGQHPRSLHPSLTGFAPEDVALGSGRPTLVVPLALGHERIGQNIIIAWDGTREAVRAVYDGMPLLRDATRIVVAEIDQAAQAAGPEYPSADALLRVLERHGFQAFLESRPSGGDGIEAALEELVVELGADLLIAGLYHHSRWREALFGGVSRDLLRRMPVPILLAH